MKTFNFKITAKIVKNVSVEIDVNGLNEDEAIEAAREAAHEQFNILDSGDEEEYTEDSVYIENFSS